MNIQKKLISINYTKETTIKPKYIVIHETDNTSKGADALANRNYFANHPEAKASTHFVVDDHSFIQCAELNWKCWHVGDNKGHSMITNSNSIGIEICVNSDGNYAKARQNAIELVKYLMSVAKIPASRVVRHYDASGKHCPRKMLDCPSLWTSFKNAIQTSEAETLASNKVGIVNTNILNVRDKANNDAKIIGLLKKGRKIQLVNKVGNWWSIIYGKNVGWVCADYIKI